VLTPSVHPIVVNNGNIPERFLLKTWVIPYALSPLLIRCVILSTPVSLLVGGIPAQLGPHLLGYTRGFQHFLTNGNIPGNMKKRRLFLDPGICSYPLV